MVKSYQSIVYQQLYFYLINSIIYAGYLYSFTLFIALYDKNKMGYHT